MTYIIDSMSLYIFRVRHGEKWIYDKASLFPRLRNVLLCILSLVSQNVLFHVELAIVVNALTLVKVLKGHSLISGIVFRDSCMKMQPQ